MSKGTIVLEFSELNGVFSIEYSSCTVNEHNNQCASHINLSTDVFEPRTATGSRMAWFFPLPWTGKLLFLCLQFDVTNAMASKRSKEEKIQLPVDVRGSKTSVLKFPKKR